MHNSYTICCQSKCTMARGRTYESQSPLDRVFAFNEPMEDSQMFSGMLALRGNPCASI